MKLYAYVDGSCFGNPGEAGYGFVIQDSEGNPLEEQGVYIGRATNNIAEYSALIGCLDALIKYKPDEVTVYSDSQLLVNQINGDYAVKKDHLKELYSKVMHKINKLSAPVKIVHVLRDKKKKADSLARKAVLKKESITI